MELEIDLLKSQQIFSQETEFRSDRMKIKTNERNSVTESNRIGTRRISAKKSRCPPTSFGRNVNSMNRQTIIIASRTYVHSSRPPVHELFCCRDEPTTPIKMLRIYSNETSNSSSSNCREEMRSTFRLLFVHVPRFSTEFNWFSTNGTATDYSFSIERPDQGRISLLCSLLLRAAMITKSGRCFIILFLLFYFIFFIKIIYQMVWWAALARRILLNVKILKMPLLVDGLQFLRVFKIEGEIPFDTFVMVQRLIQIQIELWSNPFSHIV